MEAVKENDGDNMNPYFMLQLCSDANVTGCLILSTAVSLVCMTAESFKVRNMGRPHLFTNIVHQGMLFNQFPT